ncbi:hypothetical protein AAFF_G00280170 [Aldrovandia affinis]|uniref:Nuclear receptor-binding factor 2 MIT domain-containing protein n=1 Tax=Aldrovandia affinis TaxID=143900 RepID=A0AAD7RA33_9TELE|nr:hypothetical protein AAFF_G00280170 [Aldrovandia affinis]
MEVLENPLNRAHQWSRKADRLLAAGKYEEAVSCHGEAADLLKEAMKLTQCEQARLSMELQKDDHIKQLRLIKEKQKRAGQEGRPRYARSATARSRTPPGESARASRAPERRRRPAPAPLKLVDFLLTENEKLARENRQLQAESVQLRSRPRPKARSLDTGAERRNRPLPVRDGKAKAVPGQLLPPLGLPDRDVSPMGRPARDFPLESLPPLELPEGVEHGLQELVGRDLL